MQAHTSGEVGILGTVLLNVYSGTTFAIFIEIGLYLTEKEQKISWHSFLRHGVVKHTTVYFCIQCAAKKVYLNVFAIFLATARNFYMKLRTFITHS